MAYDPAVSRPVKLVDGVMGGGAIGRGGALWYYASNDTDADVDADDYFTDGKALGMKLGDVVFVVDVDAPYALTVMVVRAVGAAAASVKVSEDVTP